MERTYYVANYVAMYSFTCTLHVGKKKEDSGRKSAIKSAEVLQKLQHKSVQCAATCRPQTTYVTLDFDPEQWWFVLEKYGIDEGNVRHGKEGRGKGRRR